MPSLYQRNRGLILETFAAQTAEEQNQVLDSALEIAAVRDRQIAEYNVFVDGFTEMCRLRNSYHNFDKILVIAASLKKPDYNPDCDYGLVGRICDSARKGDFASAQRVVRTAPPEPPMKIDRVINRAWDIIKIIRQASTENEKRHAIQRLRLFKGNFWRTSNEHTD